MKILKLFLVGSTVALAVGCTTREQKAARNESNPSYSNVSSEAKSAALTSDATYVAEIAFNPNSSDLNSRSKGKLLDVIREAKKRGKIEEVKVIAWSDMEYPSQQARALPKSQKDLAENRGSKIKEYIASEDNEIDVDTYNMTSRPSALSRLFKTDNAKVKKSLEVAGVPNTDSGPFDGSSKAGKAVIMVILKE